MRRRQHPGWLATALWVASVLPAAAEESAAQLDQVVVSATRTEVLQEDVPGSVSVVTAEEIRESNAADVLEAIRDTAGISLSGRGLGGRKVISVRGLDSRHTLLLLDGRRISASDDNVGHSDFQYNWVPVESIERIEVVRGPLSSLYGSEALGGVVNVITKPPTDTWTGVLDISGGLPTDREQGQGYALSAYGSGPLADRLLMTASAEAIRQNDTPDEDEPRYSELEGKEIQGGAAGLIFELDPRQTLRLDLLGNHEDRWRDSFGSSGDYLGEYEIDRLQTSLTYRGRFDKSTLEARLYRSWEDAEYKTSAGDESRNTMIDRIADAAGSLAVGDNHLATVGAEYRLETLENRLLAKGEEEATHAALFAQDQISIGERFLLTAGVRWDDHEFFGSEVSPRIYGVYRATDRVRIKGGYGHGFKAPSLKRLSPDYVFRGPHTFYGNPDLQPEINDSYELAVRYDSDTTSAGMTLFRNDIKDLIDYQCIANCELRFGRGYLYVNVDEARTQGVELELATNIGRDLDLSLNYMYLDAKDTESDERLQARPRNSGNVRLRHSHAPWGLTSTLRFEYVGDQVLSDEEVPAYSLWHLAFNKTVTEHLSLRFGIDNITDVRLADKSEDFDYAERGRYVYAGLRATF